MEAKGLEGSDVDIVCECCDAIVVKGVDYYSSSTSKGCIWYSKYCSGGAYNAAFRYSIENLNFVITPYIHGKGFGWKHGATIIIDLSNPDSFELISKQIRKIFDNMQTDRKKW